MRTNKIAANPAGPSSAGFYGVNMLFLQWL